MKRALLLMLCAVSAFAQIRVVAQPAKSPLVSFRIVFTAGSSSDPDSKPGLAYLTAMMLAGGGTKQMTYKQVVDALFPMAASVNAQVDKEMTTFYGETHVDSLQAYYGLLRSMLLDPGWRAEDFERVKEDAIHSIQSGLRNNDEELGKEVLYSTIYANLSQGHYVGGTVSSLQALTVDDVKSFYRERYAQANVILGIAGGYPAGFLEKVKADFRRLPPASGFPQRYKMPRRIQANEAVIIEKDTRSVALSLGFPISCTRKSPDFAALLVAASYLGQHRMSGSVLFDEMRGKRGLNYGDYAYIEAFPRGMYQMEPSPNLARQFQIFQIWIRPVEPPNAKFALRLALYELDKLIRNGIPQDAFVRTRAFLSKYLNVLTRTQSAQLGYAIDGLYYDQPDYVQTLKQQLAATKREDVNAAIRRYLRTDRLVITAVAQDAEALKRELTSPDPSPVTYNSPKPVEVTEEDKTVEKWPLHLNADAVKTLPVDRVYR
jgi:zinc protease